MASVSDDVTRLLQRHVDGDPVAGDELLGVLYGQLHRLADAYMRGQRGDHTLQPTALVHEAFLRLVGGEGRWESREHFLALAARAMRSVLVDHARSRGAAKRGGDAERRPLEEVVVEFERRACDLLELDDALEGLSRESERAARVVELRFFGGLTAEETARALDTSLRTVERDWRTARAWLFERLSDDAGS